MAYIICQLLGHFSAKHIVIETRPPWACQTLKLGKDMTVGVNVMLCI